MTGLALVAADTMMSPTDEEVVGAASGSSNQDGKAVDMNKDQANTEAPTDGKRKEDPEQKDTSSDTKTSAARYYTDIYGRVPGKEPKYPIPCPSKCIVYAHWTICMYSIDT